MERRNYRAPKRTRAEEGEILNEDTHTELGDALALATDTIDDAFQSLDSVEVADSTHPSTVTRSTRTPPAQIRSGLEQSGSTGLRHSMKHLSVASDTERRTHSAYVERSGHVSFDKDGFSEKTPGWKNDPDIEQALNRLLASPIYGARVAKKRQEAIAGMRAAAMGRGFSLPAVTEAWFRPSVGTQNDDQLQMNGTERQMAVGDGKFIEAGLRQRFHISISAGFLDQ
jgi:hypothetical protein